MINEFNDENDRAALLTFVGTAFRGLPIQTVHPLLPQGVYVVCDAREELDKIRFREDDNHALIKVPVSDHAIVQEMVKENGTGRQREIISSIPNLSAQHGLAQLRFLGKVGLEQALDEIDFDGLFRDCILSELRRMNDGRLSNIEHFCFSGTGGGMGSAGGPALTRRIHALLTEPTDPQIESELHIIGGVTFSSQSFHHTDENAGCAVVELIHFLKHPVSSRGSCVINAREIKAVGLDLQYRDRLILEAKQAEMAPELRERELRVRSNHQVSGPVGGVMLRSTEHFNPILGAKIAADAATEYQPLIAGALAEPANVDSVDELRFRENHESVNRMSIGALLERLLDLETEAILDKLAAPAQRYLFELVVCLVNRQTISLGDAKVAFSEPVKSIEAARTRMSLLRTCYVACELKLGDLMVELNDLTEDEPWLRDACVKAIRSVRGGWFRRIRTWWESDEERIDKAATAFSELRENTDQQHAISARITVLQVAIDGIAAEEEQLCHKLRTVVRELDQCLPKGGEAHKQRLIVPRPINDLMEPLLRFSESPEPNRDELVRILVNGVQTVSVEGLAAIVGCESSLEAIVGAVTSGQGIRDQCPPWGGSDRLRHASDRAIVFPPVASDLRSKLEAAFLEGSEQIAFASTAVGSVNIVRVTTTYPQQIHEFLTPFYDSGVRKALASSQREMFVIYEEAYRALGYEI